MKVNKLDHICIAVRNLDNAHNIWKPMLGKSVPDDAYVDEPKKTNWRRFASCSLVADHFQAGLRIERSPMSGQAIAQESVDAGEPARKEPS